MHVMQGVAAPSLAIQFTSKEIQPPTAPKTDSAPPRPLPTPAGSKPTVGTQTGNSDIGALRQTWLKLMYGSVESATAKRFFYDPKVLINELSTEAYKALLKMMEKQSRRLRIYHPSAQIHLKPLPATSSAKYVNEEYRDYYGSTKVRQVLRQVPDPRKYELKLYTDSASGEKILIDTVEATRTQMPDAVKKIILFLNSHPSERFQYNHTELIQKMTGEGYENLLSTLKKQQKRLKDTNPDLSIRLDWKGKSDGKAYFFATIIRQQRDGSSEQLGRYECTIDSIPDITQKVIYFDKAYKGQ